MTPDPRARVKEIAERHEKDEAVAESNFGRDTWEGEMHQDRAELLSIVEALRNEVLEEAAQELDKEFAAVVRGGDQFDQGGDIYNHAAGIRAAAQTVRSLKSTPPERATPRNTKELPE